MHAYKGIELDPDLIGLIGHMTEAEEYRETLQGLQSVWDNLTLLGQLSGTGTDMTRTRQAFHQLTSDLLNHFGQETLKKTVLGMTSKAQVAVDIMIRNLFERTADIGFLATDQDLRDYLVNVPRIRRELEERFSDDRNPLRERLEAMHFRLRQRFDEYVRKYSVYNDIILLDLEGRVLARLDSSHTVEATHDPLVNDALNTSAAYVERFGPCDLRPNEATSLIYAYRVSDDQDDRPLGVLCLSFRFHNETEGIFANLVQPGDWSVLGLLDESGTVIASSDPWQIPVGARMDKVLDRNWRVVRFAGRDYLACTRATQGYQGYMGPGWYGHVMLPLEHAFEADTRHDPAELPAAVLEQMMRDPTLFSEALRRIPMQAQQIQRDLNRSVWNGNVRQSSDKKAINPAFSKVLLWEISNTGLKTQDVFERSIGNLHRTVVSAILQDSRFQAALAIDIMDRNLYERANDCRWWALNSRFRELLAHTPLGEAEVEQARAILGHINGLYTVYSNLLLFDRQGVVAAVSNPEFMALHGKSIGEEWVRDCLALAGSQSYTVSNFAATPLYNGRHTYIYAAAIRHPEDEGRVVGGIGIVFDSEPQFTAMLRDALPRTENGEIPAGCFGVFADRDKRVIAASREDMRPGETLDLDDSFFQLGSGRQEISAIVAFKGRYHAVGARLSRGYREYKGETDRYRNDVIALVFMPLGESIRASETQTAPRSRMRPRRAAAPSGQGETLEIATFYVGEHWFGVPTHQVVEALDASAITSVPGASAHMLGYTLFQDNVMPVVSLRELLRGLPGTEAHATERQIVVIRDGEEGGCLGLLVDALGEIPEVPIRDVEKISTMLAGDNLLAESIVKHSDGENGSEMLVVLSPERIRARLLRLCGQGRLTPPLSTASMHPLERTTSK